MCIEFLAVTFCLGRQSQTTECFSQVYFMPSAPNTAPFFFVCRKFVYVYVPALFEF